jgi:hypothetical protein
VFCSFLLAHLIAECIEAEGMARKKREVVVAWCRDFVKSEKSEKRLWSCGVLRFWGWDRMMFCSVIWEWKIEAKIYQFLAVKSQKHCHAECSAHFFLLIL